MKNKQKKQLFITIAIILILIAVFCLIHFLNRTKMNSGYVNGNSAGNLYNGGLFCESNGTVFFSNPSDNHRLYSMNPDGSDMKSFPMIPSLISMQMITMFTMSETTRVRILISLF